jgi:hypothetical protein
MMGLVVAVMVGSMDVAPAIAKDKGGQGRGHYENRGRGFARGNYEHGRHVYHPYGYSETVYAPPQVIYAQPLPPPPGIGVFFPPIFIRP